jgi:hypothetical protein
MTINYQVKGCMCITECPNRVVSQISKKTKKVGSLECEKCRYFSKKNDADSGRRSLECTFPNEGETK